jgi:hypothetical protein
MGTDPVSFGGVADFVGADPMNARKQVAALRGLYGRDNAARIPKNWRDRLPDPATYYAACVVNLGKPNGTGWAQGRCPFHEDRDASLSVQTGSSHGGWRCFAGCGKGDLVAFHMRRTGRPFAEAVADLLRGGA